MASNRKKGHSRLLNSICISLIVWTTKGVGHQQERITYCIFNHQPVTEVSGPCRGLDVLHGVGGEVASFNLDQRKLKYGKIWAEIHQNSEVLRS